MTKKEIVDNETGGYTMAQFLNEALKESDGSVSIATGFFNVEGYAKIRDSLQESAKNNRFNLSLLFGKEATSRRDTAISLQPADVEETSLVDELDGLSLDEKSAKLIDDFVIFLRRTQVQVRKNQGRFTHAKCYIFDDSVVVGSSNLTKAGLSTNIELNAVLYQPSAQKEVRAWFDRRWNQAEDAKAELIQLLEDSKFGLPLDPYLMYMKFLYEYYKPRLEELERERGKIIELTTFQQDAVNTALRIIRKYNGVLIADSTGLGKTHIGLELLRELVAVKRKKALLVAPAQVLNTVWEPKLLEESIKTKNVTLESTGTPSFRPEENLDVDVVVVDESQNYRNPSTKRHDNIMKVLGGGKRKQVILLTATPVNNSLMDLYHQLSLITAGDDTHFVDLGIPDLRSHFISADRKQLSQGIEDIVRILDELMIRRTRQFIVENYKGAELNGKPIRFPQRKLEKVEYSLTQLFGGAVYKQVLDTIDALHLAPYRVEYYRMTTEEREREEVDARATLQKIGLLKRFESSVEAIRKSIGRLLNFYESFAKTLEQNKVLSSKQFTALLQEIGDDLEDEDAFYTTLEKIPLDELTPEYDKKQMVKDVTDDIKLLQPLKKNLDKILPFTDRKLQALKEELVKDNVFETGGKKVVIFTQFVDTARYVFSELKDVYKGEEARLLTGETDEDTRARIIKDFAPRANAPKEFIVREVDILVSTDILAEGQNLQDANYVVNYDLPWNPMKIVQRVGRVDRLGSAFDEVTAAVFLPEQQLEDILKLLEKLQTKIQKASYTVGVEESILGERANPKNFNATTRIAKEDQQLMEDLERGAELLPFMTPFQFILKYIQKAGSRSLASIPLGKRSGKKSDENGVVVFYREKKSDEGIHMIFYDYRKERFDHYNDIAWIFRMISCDPDEKLKLPVSGYNAFRQFTLVDSKARDEILKAVNAPFDAKGAQRIKPKHQREIASTILSAFNEGNVSKDEALPIFEVLNHGNLVAWEDEFADFMDDYKRDQNAQALLASLASLLQRYRIGPRERSRPKALDPHDFEVVCYMFLSRPDISELTLDA